MRAQKTGRIDNCSSILGFVAARFSGAYVASKYALEGWSDTLRLELAGTGIFVSLIEPGPIATRFGEHAREHFLATVDPAQSAFQAAYRSEDARRSGAERRSRFEAGPEAVTRVLLRALDSPRPRARYRVTLPTHLAAWGRRILPTRALDWFILQQR